MNDKKILDSRVGLSGKLRKMNNMERVLLGLLLSALLGYYAPLLFAAAFGAHVPFTFGLQFWIAIGVLSLTNYVGLRTRHVLIANLLLVSIFDVPEIVITLRQSPLSELLNLGWSFWITNAGVAINAAIFLTYGHYAGTLRDPKSPQRSGPGSGM